MKTRGPYSGLDPYALQAFKGCHNRARDGKAPSIEWPRNGEGYLQFCAEIGRPPAGMEKPSVGRKDHSIGYCSGNVQWEEHKFNSAKRNGTRHQFETSPVVRLRQAKFKKGTPEHAAHQRFASLMRWQDPKQREKMSLLMKGNRYASKSP